MVCNLFFLLSLLTLIEAYFSLMKLTFFFCKLAAIANCHGHILISSPVLSGEGHLIHFSAGVSAFNLVKPFGAEPWHHFKKFFSIKASLGAQRCCSSPVCLGDRYCHFHLNLTWPVHSFSQFTPFPSLSRIITTSTSLETFATKCANVQIPKEKKLRRWRHYWVSFCCYEIQPTFNILSFSDSTSMTALLRFSFTNLRPSVGYFFPHY